MCVGIKAALAIAHTQVHGVSVCVFIFANKKSINIKYIASRIIKPEEVSKKLALKIMLMKMLYFVL